MMRILTPKGILVEVLKAEPFVETRVQFNGDEVRLCQIAKDKNQMSGLYFTLASSDSGIGFLNQNNSLIGNLKLEKVEEIMHELLTKGYADLSVLEYQPAPEQDKLTVFDAGESLPYYVDKTIGSTVYAPASADMLLGGNVPFSMGMGMASGRDVFAEEEPVGADDEEDEIR